MKTWAWRVVYVLLAYTGFVVALNTMWGREEQASEWCATGCCR